MCLAAWTADSGARFPWVLASNRDEFHDRPAAPLAWWQPAADVPPVLSGRDLSAGGSWLALRRDGRLALVTNVREPGRFVAGLPSRGDLVLQGLQAGPGDSAWLGREMAVPRNGFNLLLADVGDGRLTWASNRAAVPRHLQGGVHGLSNAALDTPWPKVEALKLGLRDAVQAQASVQALADACFSLLAARSVAADGLLPRTGVPLQRERQLSPAFIHIAADAGMPAYGTRCSTLVIVQAAAGRRHVHVIERRFDATGATTGDSHEDFELAPAR
jgi:uncharacterized protein with NRDE domain